MDGVEVDRSRPLLRIGNAPVHPAFAARALAAIRRHRPDVVVAHTPAPFPAEMAFRAARRAGVPFVTTYHAGRLRGSSPGLAPLAALDRATLERRMLEGSARLVAVSPYVRDHALARVRERVAVVPPGVDAARFSPDGTGRGRSILFVGPLDRRYRWKGVDTLRSAFEVVRRTLPDARLVLVGDGDRRPAFERWALLERGAVRVAGRLPEEALVKEYRTAGVTALPSRTDAEAFGMVLAEASACGCPVVGSAIGGIPDFIEDGRNGLLARPGDAADLAEALVRVLQDDGLGRRLAQSGRRRVMRDHDWDRLTARTEDLLEAAAGRPSR